MTPLLPLTDVAEGRPNGYPNGKCVVSGNSAKDEKSQRPATENKLGLSRTPSPRDDTPLVDAAAAVDAAASAAGASRLPAPRSVGLVCLNFTYFYFALFFNALPASVNATVSSCITITLSI